MPTPRKNGHIISGIFYTLSFSLRVLSVKRPVVRLINLFKTISAFDDLDPDF